MTERKFDLVARVSPYSDGSGYQVTASVVDDEDGPSLRIEMAHRIRTDEWPALRRAIDDLVELAQRRA